MSVTIIRSNYGKITMNSTTTVISSLDGEQSSLDIGSLKLKGYPFIQSTDAPGLITINASCTALNDITDAGSGEIITDAERTKLDTLPEKITLLSGSVAPGGFALLVDLNSEFRSLTNAIQGSYFVGTLTVKYSADGQTEKIALYRGHVSYTGGAAGDLSIVTHTLQGTGTNGAEMLFQSNIFKFNPSSTETYRYVITIQE